MDPTRTDPIPNPAVRRLSLYLRQLESFKRKDRRTVSSKQLGESLNLTDAQVRKDLAYFGQFGHPGIGYRVDDLIAQARRILGTDKIWNVLLVGAGNLGRALMAYNGFDAKGFRLVAVFDSAPGLIGKRQGPFSSPQGAGSAKSKRFFSHSADFRIEIHGRKTGDSPGHPGGSCRQRPGSGRQMRRGGNPRVAQFRPGFAEGSQ